MLEQQRPTVVTHLPPLRRRARRAPEVHRPAEPGPGQTGSALTAVAKIRADRVDALDRLLTEIGDDIRNNPHIRFERLTTVHFMRWVILRRQDGLSADYLVLESNYDGSLDAHLADLSHAAGDALHRIYAHCSDYALKGDRFGPSERVALEGHPRDVIRREERRARDAFQAARALAGREGPLGHEATQPRELHPQGRQPRRAAHRLEGCPRRLRRLRSAALLEEANPVPALR